jgi:hypothetical protein
MKKRKPSNSKPLPVKNFFARVLPENYRAHASLIHQFQHFFQQMKDDAVYQQVTVNNVSDNLLHVSLPNSTLANYFRLHELELKQSIENAFSIRPSIKVSVKPEQQDKELRREPLKPVSEKVADQIGKSSEAVEDEHLKAAIKSLSATLARRQRK